MKVRTLIAEDEPLARERLRDLLANDPDIEQVGECANGPETVEAIRRLRPDLVFLDIKMPELGGFEVLSNISDALPSAIVFVTAYEQYAVKAFEVNAIDYLLKPFDRQRLEQCLQRVKHRLSEGGTSSLQSRLQHLLQEMEAKSGGSSCERLAVKSAGRIVFVNTEDIDWIEAADNYMKLHDRNGEHLMRETMASLEARLDPRRFLRISRSIIVNTDRIREIQPLFHGDSVVVLKDGTRLNASRGYKEKLKQFLNS